MRHSPSVDAILELMIERDWSVSDVAQRMGGRTPKDVVTDQAFLCLYLVFDDKKSLLTFDFALKLSEAFGLPRNHFYALEYSVAR